MKVLILSYADFNQYVSIIGTDYPDKIFISILDSEGWFSKPQNIIGDNTLTIQCDDVFKSGEPSPTNPTTNTRAFDKDDAKKIIDLLQKYPEASECVVHCAAGISRSGAVGEFVNDWYKADYYEFAHNNPKIHPNGLILRTLKRLMR
jgi:predicted protein tyrosine phosphatase